MLNLFETRVSVGSMPPITKTQIVCGDCGGDELLPRRTFLTGDGRCAVCGGRSFVIASQICEALAREIKNKRRDEEEIWKTEILMEEQEQF